MKSLSLYKQKNIVLRSYDDISAYRTMYERTNIRLFPFKNEYNNIRFRLFTHVYWRLTCYSYIRYKLTTWFEQNKYLWLIFSVEHGTYECILFLTHNCINNYGYSYVITVNIYHGFSIFQQVYRDHLMCIRN